MIINNYSGTLPENKEEFFSNQFVRVCPKIFLKRYKERIYYTENLVIPYYVIDNDNRRSWKKSGNKYEIDHFNEDYTKTFTTTIILDPDSDNPREFKQTTFWGDQVFEINLEFTKDDVGPHCFGIKCTQNDGISSIMHFAKFMVDDPEETFFEVNLNNISEFNSSFTADREDSLRITPFIHTNLNSNNYPAVTIALDPLAALLHEHPLDTNYPSFYPGDVALVDKNGNPQEFRVAINKSKKFEYGKHESPQGLKQYILLKTIIADYQVTVNRVDNEVESIIINIPESENDEDPNGFKKVPILDNNLSSYEYDEEFATNYPSWECQSETGYIYRTDINYFTGNSTTASGNPLPSNSGGQTKEKISGIFELTTVWIDDLGQKHKLEDYISSKSRDIPDGARLAAVKNKIALTRLCEAVTAGAEEGQRSRLILPQNWKIVVDYHEYNPDTDSFIPGSENRDSGINSGGTYITLPNNFTLDLNGTEIWAMPSHDIGKGSILGIGHNFDTHVINGSILGSYRYRSYLEQESGGGCSLAEGVGNTFIRSSEFCTYENMKIAYSLSYDADMGSGGGIAASAALSGNGKSVTTFNTSGYIDKEGNIIEFPEFNELPEEVNKKLIIPRVSTAKPNSLSIMDDNTLYYPLKGVASNEFVRTGPKWTSLYANNNNYLSSSIFIYKKGDGNEYSIVKNISELSPEDKLIVVCGRGKNTNNHEVKVMGNPDGNNRSSVTIQAVGGTITPTEDCCIITLKKNDKYWNFQLEDGSYLSESSNSFSTSSSPVNYTIYIDPITYFGRVIFSTANSSSVKFIHYHLDGYFIINDKMNDEFYLFKKNNDKFIPILSESELVDGLEVIFSNSMTSNKYTRIMYQEDTLQYNSNASQSFNTRGAIINKNLELSPLKDYQLIILRKSDNNTWKLELKDVLIDGNPSYLYSNREGVLIGNTTGLKFTININSLTSSAKIKSGNFAIRYIFGNYSTGHWGRGDAVLEWGNLIKYGKRTSFTTNNDYLSGNIYSLYNAYKSPGVYHLPYKREAFVHFYKFDPNNETDLNGISKYMEYLKSYKVVSGYPFIPPKKASHHHLTATGSRVKTNRNYLEENDLPRVILYTSGGAWSCGYKNCVFHDERSSLFDNNYANQCFAEDCYMYNLGAERSVNDAGWSNQNLFIDIEDNSFHNKDFYINNCENIYGGRGLKVHFSFNLNITDCKNMNPYLLKGVNGVIVEGLTGKLREEMSISNPINYHIIKNNSISLINNNYGAFGDGKKDIGLEYNTVHTLSGNYTEGVYYKNCFNIN